MELDHLFNNLYNVVYWITIILTANFIFAVIYLFIYRTKESNEKIINSKGLFMKKNEYYKSEYYHEDTEKISSKNVIRKEISNTISNKNKLAFFSEKAFETAKPKPSAAPVIRIFLFEKSIFINQSIFFLL